MLTRTAYDNCNKPVVTGQAAAIKKPLALAVQYANKVFRQGNRFRILQVNGSNGQRPQFFYITGNCIHRWQGLQQPVCRVGCCGNDYMVIICLFVICLNTAYGIIVIKNTFDTHAQMNIAAIVLDIFNCRFRKTVAQIGNGE